ncbi:MAG: AI-2E family transporter [Bacilli bacterium]|nr:AI-2E family transporter [Bacilli bacterium]
MIKNKLDYKLINIAIIVFIGFLLLQTKNFWLDIVIMLIKIVMPFVLAFAMAYAFYPFLKYLQKKKISKGFGVLIIVSIILAVIAILVGIITPLLFNQLSSLFNDIINFIKDISENYDLNLGPLQESLSSTFNDIIASFGNYAKDGAISIINQSLSAISIAVIAFSSAIYFLLDMDKIRAYIRFYTLKKSHKDYDYLKAVDKEMNNYLSGFLKIVIISMFEYYLAFLIIGHPNALLLGFLAAIGSFIPYFGGMLVNVIAAITAFVISPFLFLKTVIAFFILSMLDSYLIGPKVYGKTNNVHPLIVIMAVFAGGILFGVWGIVISLPVALIIITTYKFFEDDIINLLTDKKK